MICTAARGGMRAMVDSYEMDGLFSRWNIRLLFTHNEGGIIGRLVLAGRAYLALLGMLVTGQVRLLHCHTAMRGSFWRKSIFSLSALAFRVPVVFHLHGSEMKSFVSSQPKILRRLIGWILEKQTRVIVLSTSWENYVRSIAPRARVVVLPNYVRLPDLATRTPSENKNNIRTLFLGLVCHRKGVYDLLPAFREALLAVPNLHLIIGGNGEVDQARGVASELGISEQVTFTGWISGEDKRAQLQAADIYVLPSHNEGLPVSLLEAMSWQLPVLTTRVGGIAELVREGIDGYLVAGGDRPALTLALSRLASDAGLRARMGHAGRQRVEELFSMELVLPKLESIYSELAGKR